MGRYDPAQFTKDGKFFVWVSSSGYRNIQVWSLDEKKIIQTFPLTGYTILLTGDSPAINSDIYFITDTTGKVKSTFRQYDWTEVDIRVLDSHRKLRVIGHWNIADIGRRLIAPDGKGIAYRKPDGIYFRSLDESSMGPERLLVPLKDTKTGLCGLAFHPNGKFIAICQNTDTRIYSLDPPAKTPIRVVPAAGSIYFDKQGRYMAIDTGEKAQIWDLFTPEEVEPITFQHAFSEGVNAQIAFDHRGRWLVIPWASSIEFYPLMKMPYLFRNDGAGSSYIRFMPDGNHIVDGFDDAGLRVLSVPGEAKPESRSVWKSDYGFGYSIFFDIDPSGRHAFASTNRALKDEPYFVSLEDGKTVSLKNQFPGRANHSISFSPDGKFAATACLHEGFLGVVIWNVQTGDATVLEPSKGKASYCVKYAPDGSLFSGDASGNLYHWNLKDHSSKLWKIGEGIVSSIAITRDGRYVAAIALKQKTWGEGPSGTSDFMMIDLKTNRIHRILTHGNRLFRVVLDPSGTRIVTGDMDGTVRVGPVTGEEPHLLFGHDNLVGDVAVDPKGKWIASTEMNKSVVRLWPMPQGQPLQTLSHDDFLNYVEKLTNMRVVADKSSSSGYRVEAAPFSGWQQ